MTPTEIVNAYNAGAVAVKIFPIVSLGIEYIKAIKSPISHIPILAVGGVDLDNVGNYIRAGVIGVGIGSCLVDKKLINKGKFNEITELAKKFVNNVQV